ncbi:MAG: heme o synthase [Elusimicrobia bacterium]|nr:heme o synthase [Elusimicrobiota bacterium]
MKHWISLTKPRIAFMMAVTSGLGWALAGGTATTSFWVMTAGVILSSAAAGTLNQRLEIVEDGLMNRTKNRALPRGAVTPAGALAFGLILSVVGTGLVWASSNLLAAGLTLTTILLYVCAYTPLKKITPQATWVGAAAGAIPPMIGWAAFAGSLSPKAWSLFGIQFLWQIPHFLALFWIYREEYARAGFRVMPVVHPDGGTTSLQIAMHSFTLLPAVLLPVLLGMAGLSYAIPAFVVAVVFLGLGMRASWTMAVVDARRLFLASLAFLPLIFGMLYFGGV